MTNRNMAKSSPADGTGNPPTQFSLQKSSSSSFMPPTTCTSQILPPSLPSNNFLSFLMQHQNPVVLQQQMQQFVGKSTSQYSVPNNVPNTLPEPIQNDVQQLLQIFKQFEQHQIVRGETRAGGIGITKIPGQFSNNSITNNNNNNIALLLLQQQQQQFHEWLLLNNCRNMLVSKLFDTATDPLSSITVPSYKNDDDKQVSVMKIKELFNDAYLKAVKKEPKAVSLECDEMQGMNLSMEAGNSKNIANCVKKQIEVQENKGQSRLPSRFFIDGLLESDNIDHHASNNRKPTPWAMVDYFMAEQELSWTDGRRCRQVSSAKQMANDAKKETKRIFPKSKQPPLPSSSSNSGNYRLVKHVCSECGKSYATSSNLSRHKQTHRSLDSPHAKKCSYCDRVYVSMPALSMHLLTHQARHKCPLCGKLFSRPWLLKGHLRSHTGQKPFGCGNCGKAFSDRSNLRAHLNTHNNGKYWRCDFCGQTFAVKSYLIKHMEQQHGSVIGGTRHSGDDGSSGLVVDAMALPSLCEHEEEILTK